jgi:hypothetical protein
MQHVRVRPGDHSRYREARIVPLDQDENRIRISVRDMDAFGAGIFRRAVGASRVFRAVTRAVGLRRRAGPSPATTASRQIQGNRSNESACPRAGAVAARARTRRRAARAARGATGSGALLAARASGGERGSAQGSASGVGFAARGRREPRAVGSLFGKRVRGAARALPAWHVQANAQGHARDGASRFVRRSRIARVLMPWHGVVSMQRPPCPADRCPRPRCRPRCRTRRPHAARAALSPAAFRLRPGWASSLVTGDNRQMDT